MLLNTEEIKQEIAEGLITAITLDTSIFDASQNGFENGALSQLKQFLGSDTSLVISDVVEGEVKAHVIRNAHDAEAKVRAELKAVGSAWQASRATREAAMNLLVGGETPEKMFSRRYGEFVRTTGLVVVESAALIDVKRLLEDYFAVKPPFGTNAIKKNEFPDAIALQALERWAQKAGTKMLVVTKDGDWKSYCNLSEALIAIDDLGEALSLFHEDSTVICALLSTQAARDKLNLRQFVEDELSSSAENIDFIPDAFAAYYYEPEVCEIAVEEFDFLPIRNLGDVIFKPVDRDGDSLVVEAQLMVKISVTTSFSFSVTDSIDRDEVPIGSSSVSQVVEMGAKAFITFEGNLVQAPVPTHVEIEFERRSLEVDYGEVGPDWGDDDGETS